jgi:transcriptional regulator with PAS, ATPase and Fis domain
LPNDVGSATIIYCGDPQLYERWQSGVPRPEVETFAKAKLLAAVKQAPNDYSCIVLSLYNTSLSRMSATATPAELANDTLEHIAAIHQIPGHPPIVLLTPQGLPLDICCSAVRMGVAAFIDFDAADWIERLDHTLDSIHAAPAASSSRKADPKALLDAVGIMAVSPAMQDLIMQVYRGAQVSDATVLIHGESGTGKQLLAEAIHRLDPKRNKFTFVPVNCAAITGTLAESELFGHSRGAFSGATENRLGYFRTANRGTIFLDEISELPMALQPKLLRVLQERQVMAVGSDKEEAIDVRVIAASNVSLQEKVAKGEFRLDLYQRLNVIHLTVPPLRQRAEDIPLLVNHFIRKYQHYCLQQIKDVDPRVHDLLKSRLGHGNVRELENVIRQTLVFKTSGDRVELADLPRYLFETEEGAPPRELIPSDIAAHLVHLIRDRRMTLRQVVDTFEKTLILQAAKASPQMSKVELAKTLGLPRRTLYYKLDGQEGMEAAEKE